MITLISELVELGYTFKRRGQLGKLEKVISLLKAALAILGFIMWMSRRKK